MLFSYYFLFILEGERYYPVKTETQLLPIEYFNVRKSVVFLRFFFAVVKKTGFFVKFKAQLVFKVAYPYSTAFTGGNKVHVKSCVHLSNRVYWRQHGAGRWNIENA